MLSWGPLLVLLAQAASPAAAEHVVQPECHIPAAPPCIPFSDPRWRTEGCKIENGACFVLGVVEESLEIEASLTISPECKDDESQGSLREAALSALHDSGYTVLSWKETILQCSPEGFVDVEVNVKPGR